MKIQIPLDFEQLNIMNRLLSPVYEIKSETRAQKINISILRDLSDKFQIKYYSKKKDRDLLNSRKKFKMSLKFHEAESLRTFLAMCLDTLIFTTLERSKVSRLHNYIDQKTI